MDSNSALAEQSQAAHNARDDPVGSHRETGFLEPALRRNHAVRESGEVGR